jgi:Neuraminidase (sialidase)
MWIVMFLEELLMIEYSDIKLDFKLAPKTDANVFLHEKVLPLAFSVTGPFIRNDNGDIICVADRTVFLSKNEGKTWQENPLFQNDKWLVQDTHALRCTKDNVIVLSFLNMANAHFNWVEKTNLPTKNTRLDLCVVRSLDGGKTWLEPNVIQQGYCGATTTMIELKTGQLVMAAQNLDYQNGRHFSLTYFSDNQGESWQASNYLDIGGQGHHGGCYEGTLVQLNDGRIWYCIRTNQDYFWDAYSNDNGKSWTSVSPGRRASSSPAMLTRLQSGRIMKVFNQLHIEKNQDVERVGGQFSEVAASWQREELSVVFSEDEGRSWTEPLVIARCKDAWLSYPYVFEKEAGIIWLTTMQSQLKMEFKERDLLAW